MELIAAFIGAIIGALSSYLFQHRLWLRDARRQAYLDALTALNETDDAGRDYLNSLRVLATVLERSEPDEMVRWARARCTEAWDVSRARERSLERAVTAINLVGSFSAQFSVILATWGWTMTSSHGSSSGPEEIREAVEQMETVRVEARGRQKHLLQDAKDDLGIAQTLPRRARRFRRRVRGRWITVREGIRGWRRTADK